MSSLANSPDTLAAGEVDNRTLARGLLDEYEWLQQLADEHESVGQPLGDYHQDRLDALAEKVPALRTQVLREERAARFFKQLDIEVLGWQLAWVAKSPAFAPDAPSTPAVVRGRAKHSVRGLSASVALVDEHVVVDERPARGQLRNADRRRLNKARAIANHYRYRAHRIPEWKVSR